MINPNKLIKRAIALLEDRDKAVRQEAKQLLIEIYRWLGPALASQLSSLKTAQVLKPSTTGVCLITYIRPVTYFCQSKWNSDDPHYFHVTYTALVVAQCFFYYYENEHYLGP